MNNQGMYTKAYFENKVLTASPEELTLMLYDGLIKFLLRSEKCIEEKDIEGAHNNLIRCQDIIIEFINKLDMKYEVAKNYSDVYNYMHQKLIEANLKKDKEIVGEMIKMAKELRDTWIEIIKIVKNKKNDGHDNQVVAQNESK